MGAALVAAAIVAPWLVWLPFVRGGAAVALLGAVAIAAAWHGYGRLVARACRREAGAAVTVAWGVAASVAIAGVAIALHIYDARLILLAGTVAHTADTALRFGDLRARDWRRPRTWWIPVALVAVVGAIAILGAAGQGSARPFDDDGSVIAQIQRLADTHTLGDAIGYPRALQLGAHPALAGLASAFSDPTQARLVDRGLGLVLVLALALSRLRSRDTTAAAWACVLAIAACAFAITERDFAPLWLPAALLLALDATLSDDTPPVLPIALLAGALAALRLEYLGAGLVYVIAVELHGRSALPAVRSRRTLVLAGGFALAIVPFAISRAVAGSALSIPGHVTLAHVALAAAIAAAASPLALWIVRELPGRTPRVLALACVAGVASVTAFGEHPFANQLYWPLAIAAVVVLATATAVEREPGTLALVLALFVCVLVGDAQAATARDRSWSWRAYDWMADVEYARHPAPARYVYDPLLARVPAGATVAIWIRRPELVDYAQHRIVDLRTPRMSHASAARLVAASGAHWLVLEGDAPLSLDALGVPVAEADGAKLVELR